MVFPGWLRHQVTPSIFDEAAEQAGNGQRVSVSCNLHGEWRDTAELTLELSRPHADADAAAEL